MQITHAIKLAMAMSGKYNTGNKLTVVGKDAWSNPVEETIDEIDWKRLEADLAEMKNLG